MASRIPESLQGDKFQAIIPGSTIARSVTSSSAQSSAIPAGASVFYLCSTTNCHIEFGADPTATTSSFYLPAGVPMAFGVPKSFIEAGTYKVAVIRVTADGTLTILPGSVA